MVLMIYLCRYPIYRIPTGPTLKDLDACFLTYHSLYTPVGGKKEFQSSNRELRIFLGGGRGVINVVHVFRK